MFEFFRDPDPLEHDQADLAGKTVLVLGANTGLGLEAAKHFAATNPDRLILACRSASKGQAAVDKLRVATGYSKAEVWIVNLADFASVTDFADKFDRDGGRLDIVVANAALGVLKYEATKDGWEASLQVNSLATSLFCLRLLPAMLQTAQEYATLPRLVVVSSGSHYEVEALDKRVAKSPEMLKTLGSAEYCTSENMAARYPITKLCSVLFARALNAHIPSTTPLIVNTVDPGFCHSELTRNITGLRAAVITIMGWILARTAEQGSRRLVWCAVGQQEQPDKLRGEFITRCSVQEVSDYVLSVDGGRAQNRFWDETVEILSRVDPKVGSVVEKYLAV
ncbi:hypothetical protein C8F04DRAFT_1399627 [Mycena alexandri]|uniref:NAD(P)-binding protein n=1 Tax=Mycena alexandri TaxID=1745969 RepID=A0AAD6SKC6_9AGAR|nr:hypothetical protein C8F04DRAFT_1399627 [Mycena alexandri]